VGNKLWIKLTLEISTGRRQLADRLRTFDQGFLSGLTI